MNKVLLWLDDIRDPSNSYWQRYFPEYADETVIWVKNYDEFVEWIELHGLPDMIAFDHDLEPDHYEFSPEELMKGNFNHVKEYGKTGYDCAHWLVDFCINNEVSLPDYISQSANPTGKENILKLLDNYSKFANS